MKITDILEYENIEQYKKMVLSINDNMIGRVALNPTISSTEVLYIIKQLMGEDCKTVLEIGTLWGGALMTIMQSKYESNFASIDTFNGFYPELLGEGNADHEDGFNTIDKVNKNVNNNNPHQHNFDLIEGSSHDEKVINYVKEHYSEVDLLFIDGDHTKKGVLQDWNDYSSLVTKGGIVVFDDYWVGEYEQAAWKKEDEDGVKWMDVVGAVDEIMDSEDFSNNWKNVGLFGDKKIIERL